MKLLQGRPQDEEGRLEKEIRTYNLLDRLNIPYERVDHEALNTIEACAEVDRLLQVEICKNLFLCNRQETNFYLLMLPGQKPFKTKDLSHQLGVSRLSFGKPDYMERFLDITPGSVSVMGLMNDSEHNVQLLIDEEIVKAEYIGCHPCINTSSIKLKTADLLEKFLPETGHEPIIVKL
ncbi:MAG: prolyl-tRNA synthetase associated domain-containing protein [Ruminococcus sp.]